MSYIDPTAVIDDGAIIGANVSVWHFTHVRGDAELESDVSLGQNVYIDSGVRVGEASRIQNNVSVYSGVQIGRWCFVGPSVVFTNDANPRVGNKAWTVRETILALGCAIGAGAVLRCGIRIGAFALVGAGAIVTHSIPPFHMAIGVPARPTRLVCACGQSTPPSGTSKEGLIRDCCVELMNPRLLTEAQQWLAANEIPHLAPGAPAVVEP